MSPLATESDLIKLRDDIARLDGEADVKHDEAEKLVAEIRQSGVDPLYDKDAFEKVDAAYKEEDARRQEAVELRVRADRVMQSLGMKPEQRTAPTGAVETAPAGITNIGQRFIDHENYGKIRELAKQDLRAAASFMMNNPTEIANVEETQQILLRAITMPASPSPLIPADYRPPVDALWRPTTILDLITVGDTQSDTVTFVTEVYNAPAAAETAFGDPTVANSGLLPESNFQWVSASTSPKRIGHWTPATEAQMADAGQLKTLVSKRLVAGARQRTEDEVLAGNATGQNLRGILNTSGIGTVAYQETGHAGETALDTIHRAITQCRLAFVEPTGIAMEPVDYEQDIVLAKDTTGNYLFKIGEPTSVWGKPTAVTPAVPNGKALVGDFSHAVLLIRTPLVVLSSNEHADFFLRGLLAVKAEYRAAFYVDRPAAFCQATGI